MNKSFAFGMFCLTSLCVYAQAPVNIQVDASVKKERFRPIWKYFGYDEPNYTYTENGRKLIGELSSLSESPVYIRAHNLLTSGDAKPALKWGSTNAYTEDAAGNPVYNWTVVDRILQTYLDLKAKPFVEIGFMPKALSSRPEPYQHDWPKTDLYLGWTYPPNDYRKWGELVYQLVRHCVEKYGREEAQLWYWEVWNEPNISYWHGTPEQFNELYDHTAAAVKRALPQAKIGGPASTGPANAKAAAFLQQFLEHCSTGRNYVTGKTGSPLDFITYHAKGSPRVIGDHIQMGLAQNMKDVAKGFEIVRSFPKFSDLPIVLTESDPEGCAACSARTYPQNSYRNGALYPAYVAVAMDTILKLAARDRANIKGMLTWAFEFEDQPYFDGFRTLATNGVDKPVLNIFRMAGLMKGDLVKVQSDGALPLDAVLNEGARRNPDIDALAVVSENKLSVLIWNYHDDDVPAAPAAVNLHLTGLPEKSQRLLVRHYRIDADHSNSFNVWKQMGSPQHPTAEQYAKLEAAGQLQLLESPKWIANNGAKAELGFSLPRQGISLVELSW